MTQSLVSDCSCSLRPGMCSSKHFLVQGHLLPLGQQTQQPTVFCSAAFALDLQIHIAEKTKLRVQVSAE